MQTIVIGHRNPDMDSICSAIAYAELKRLTGTPNVIAARAGNTNERIDFVLQKFGVESPLFISDLSPRVADVMEREVVSVPSDCSAYEAIHLIERKRLRGLPVVDEKNRCLGLLSAFRISHQLFPPREEVGSGRRIVASLASIVQTFGGHPITGTLSAKAVELLLVVGAMGIDSFSKKLDDHHAHEVVLFVGDREEVQRRAIAADVRALVITGGLTISPEIRAEAEQAGVVMISSPHDTATSVLLARGAVKVERMLSAELATFRPETSLDEAREKAAASRHFIFPVVDEHGVLVGILSKSDFLKTIPRQLILVDHNELSQAVHGAEKTAIIEIIDHHRIGGFSSESPILFWNNPVGSTSTIVALCYRQAGVEIPPPIAGLLLAGIISDTLNLTSPTATWTDCEIVEDLAARAQTDPTELSLQIFSVGSPLLTMTPEQIVESDCKDYQHTGRRFTVSQIEELSFTHLPEKQQALIEALDRHVRAQGLFFAALLVTDINSQNSLLLISGAEALMRHIDFPARAPHLWELEDIVSRKKQLLPYLLRCLEQTT